MATTNNCFTIIGMKLIGTKNPFKQCKHALELKMDLKLHTLQKFHLTASLSDYNNQPTV